MENATTRTIMLISTQVLSAEMRVFIVLSPKHKI
jgi:hypothetical protein